MSTGDEISEGLDELSEGLSELSEEFDASRWRYRLMEAWASIRKLAEDRPETENFVDEWTPAFFAFQKLMMTAGRVLLTLKAALLHGEDAEMSDEFIEQVREEFQELGRQFPDASTIIFGLDKVDDLIDAALQNEDTRAKIDALTEGVKTLIDDLVTRAIDLILDGETASETGESFAKYAKSLESVLQRIIDQFHKQTWDN